MIGDSPTLAHHLFGQGYTLAAVIANEFGEATGLHRSALFACALVLFMLTLLVNAIARLLVLRASRGKLSTARPATGPDEGLGDLGAAVAAGA